MQEYKEEMTEQAIITNIEYYQALMRKIQAELIENHKVKDYWIKRLQQLRERNTEQAVGLN